MMDPRPYHYCYEHVERCFDADQARADWYPTFGIFREDGRCVGCLSLKRIDRNAATAEIGIILQNDSVKNRGYGTQALQAGIYLAQEQYGVRHIWADTAANNLRMQHVLTKLGFTQAERIPYGCDMLDHWEDRLRYVLEVIPG